MGKAENLFTKGYNCAQSIFCAHCEKVGIDVDTGLKLASSFGGGMGRLREVCGALTGLFMLVGLKHGYTSFSDDIAKEKHYAKIQKLAQSFEKEFGSLLCRDLLNLKDEHSLPIPEQRTKKYYKERPCLKFINFCSDLAQKELD